MGRQNSQTDRKSKQKQAGPHAAAHPTSPTRHARNRTPSSALSDERPQAYSRLSEEERAAIDAAHAPHEAPGPHGASEPQLPSALDAMMRAARGLQQLSPGQRMRSKSPGRDRAVHNARGRHAPNYGLHVAPPVQPPPLSSASDFPPLESNHPPPPMAQEEINDPLPTGPWSGGPPGLPLGNPAATSVRSSKTSPPLTSLSGGQLSQPDSTLSAPPPEEPQATQVPSPPTRPPHTHTRITRFSLTILACTIAATHGSNATPHDPRPGGQRKPGWAEQIWIVGLRDIDPPQVDKVTLPELTQKWRQFWETMSNDPRLNGDAGLIATAFWLHDGGFADRLRESPEDLIQVVSPELLKRIQLIKHAERSTANMQKVTLCGACGQCPTLPLVGGYSMHTCAGCAMPIHTVPACPVYMSFAIPQDEGIYYCRTCAPPTALNAQSFTPAVSRKQPIFPARAASDAHTPIGTRADARDAVEQRMHARMEAQGAAAEEGMAEVDPSSRPELEDAGPSSNPYRPTAPPPEAPPEDKLCHVLISEPSNRIQLEEDFIALQFHEACRDLDLPDFSDKCTAVCMRTGRTGPWLIAVHADVAQMVEDGQLTSFECFTEDGEDLTLRVLKCDPYGKPVRIAPNRPEYRETPKQRADDVKIVLVFNLPPRCVGMSLEDQNGHLHQVRAHIESKVKLMTGVKYDITQALTQTMKKRRNALNLFLNPPVNFADPFRHVRPHLPDLRCFPFTADGLDAEPVTCFMPPNMGVKLGLRTCCFRTPEACDAAAVDSRCTFKRDEIRKWEGPRTQFVPDQRDDRKRAREETAARAMENIEAAKILRAESIKKKLCKLFGEGKVSPTPTPRMVRVRHGPPHPPPVRQFELQEPPRLRLREEPHPLRLRTQRGADRAGASAPHMPLHVGFRAETMPVQEPQRALRVHASNRITHRRDEYVKPDRHSPARLGPGDHHRPRWPTSEPRIPLSTGQPDRGRHGAFDSQRSSFHAKERAALPLPALRRNSRLPLGPASGPRTGDDPAGRWVHERHMRVTFPCTPSPVPPTRTIRTDRGGEPKPHGTPRHSYRPLVANPFRCRRPSGRAPRSRSSVPLVLPCLRGVLWYSSNILWLQGRLPWNVSPICPG